MLCWDYRFGKPYTCREPVRKILIIPLRMYLQSSSDLYQRFKVNRKDNNTFLSLFYVHRDPMDMMLMEQHFLRTPLRMYSELDSENNNASNFFTAAMMEKARVQLQLWNSRNQPYDIHSMLLQNSAQGHFGQRVVPPHLWGSSSPGAPGTWAGNIPPGLMGPHVPLRHNVTPPPPTSTPSSSGSPSPSSEARIPRPPPVFPSNSNQSRFSPYHVMSKSVNADRRSESPSGSCTSSQRP